MWWLECGVQHRPALDNVCGLWQRISVNSLCSSRVLDIRKWTAALPIRPVIHKNRQVFSLHIEFHISVVETWAGFM